MRRLEKLILLMAALAIIAFANYRAFVRSSVIAKTWRKPTPTYQASSSPPSEKLEPVSLEPIGSEEAKVKIELFLEADNPCHRETWELFTKLAQAAPDRIRLELLDTGSPEGEQLAEQIGCQTGVRINGQQEFEIEEGGEKITVELHGPVGMGIAPEMLKAVLEQELRKQYGSDLSEEEMEKIFAPWEEMGFQ
ncbi:MAG TPA: hypothetical protein EYP85_07910 [Armatimonadetes bacterium]|nr:hypothetical protein [Armatimonadota bacterium]